MLPYEEVIREMIVKEVKKIVPIEVESIVKKISREIAREFLHILNLDEYKARQVLTSFIEWLVDSYDVLTCILCTLVNHPIFWYNIIVSIYELSHETLLKKFGFSVESDVEPSSIAEFYIDLAELGKCCICPLYLATSTLDPIYARLTILMNERAIPNFKEEWLNKYIAYMKPIPSSGATFSTLGTSERWAIFPKGTIRITFHNLHSNNVGKFYFYGEYMETSLETGIRLVSNVFELFVEKLRVMITRPESPLVKKCKACEILEKQIVRV